jgi:hypothetical protein
MRSQIWGCGRWSQSVPSARQIERRALNLAANLCGPCFGEFGFASQFEHRPERPTLIFTADPIQTFAIAERNPRLLSGAQPLLVRGRDLFHQDSIGSIEITICVLKALVSAHGHIDHGKVLAATIYGPSGTRRPQESGGQETHANHPCSRQRSLISQLSTLARHIPSAPSYEKAGAEAKAKLFL